ncbi:TMEM175 family protein [Dyella kyungheensis]|uniref:TMEM175 family protein n=1 Tax=Dyella kyungheensis TaxID=1242174 RepID=UPI003CFAF591
MRPETSPDNRVAAFSDGVIAVIITLMVLELKAPDADTFSALWPLWPTMLSYAVSYLFIAIVWLNHRHLMQYARHATSRLIWVNFAHLFAVSLVPFTTAWVARTILAAAPVAVYAAVFVGVNAAYRVFESEVLKQVGAAQMGEQERRMRRRRSLSTLLIFAAASLTALVAPRIGFAMICAALFLYLRPEAPFHWRLRGFRRTRHPVK